MATQSIEITRLFIKANATNSCDGISVQNATEITVIFSADTDYIDCYPKYRTCEGAEALFNRVSETVSNATQKGFDELLKAHKDDFSSLYNRVSLNLDGNVMGPADKLIHKYNNRLFINTLFM